MENLKDVGIPDHLTYLLRNLFADRKATIRTLHERNHWFKTGKEVHQGKILLPCIFSIHAAYIMQNVRLDESQAGIKIAKRNNNNLRHVDHTSLIESIKRN